MKNSRNIKTVDLIEALRRCSTPGVHCDGCVFCSDEDHEEPWCGDVLLQEAASRLEEYTDRCARYAEEIAVLKAAAKERPSGLSAEELIYTFTVNHEGELVFNAQTEDDSGRLMQIDARGANGKRHRHFIVAHESTPVVALFRSCLEAAIADVVPLEEVR